MGEPKLLLPFRQATIIDQVLTAWSSSQVDDVIIVCRRNDHALIERCRAHRCKIVRPDHDPPDMKASVQCALDHIEHTYQPRGDDAWLLSPADFPMLRVEVIQKLLQAFQQQRLKIDDPSRHAIAPDNTIMVPVSGNHRGHPVLFSWSLAAAVRRLPANQGVNQLLRQFPVNELPVDSDSVLHDMDTPDDYRRLMDDTAPSRQPPEVD